MIGELVRALTRSAPYHVPDATVSINRQAKGAVLAVAPMLRSLHRETRWRAAVAQELIGPSSVEFLVLAAGHRDLRVRLPAIWAPGRTGDERSITTPMQQPARRERVMPLVGGHRAGPSEATISASGRKRCSWRTSSGAGSSRS